MRAPGHDEELALGFLRVCGKGALEEVAVDAPVLPDGPVVPRAMLADLPERLRQPGFDITGGLHATGLFDSAGRLLLVREDVGRHNAMDNVVGRALMDGLLPAARPSAVRQRPSLVRARPEGRRRRLPGARRRRRSDVAGGRAGRRPRRDAVRLCARGEVNVYTGSERVGR